jgi:predicted CopG family antitoxin
MGEKVAANGVINRLLPLLADTDHSVRSRAYEALEKMGEKVAANEVINRLLPLLADTDHSVRSGAYEALEKMDEKAASGKVIKRLLSLLSDTNYSVRRGACKALWNMGEKAAINKVFGVLLDAGCENEGGIRDSVGERTAKIFGSFPCMSNLEEDIAKAENIHHDSNCWFRKTSSPEEFIRVFLHTKRSFWLPIITRLSIQKGYGITVTENTIVVYGNKEPVEIPFSSIELGQQLQQYFGNSLKNSLQQCE